MANPTTIDGLLAAFLVNDAGVAAITTRIRPWSNTIAQDLPYATYYAITTDRPKSNDGPIGQALRHYQIDCYAADLLTACQLADAIRLAADGYSGTFQGWKVDSMWITNELDATGEPVAPGQASPVQRRTLDLTLSVAEAIPQRS